MIGLIIGGAMALFAVVLIVALNWHVILLLREIKQAVAKVPPKRGVLVTQDIEDKIILLHEEGVPGEAIAKSCGVSKTTVWRRIRDWEAAQKRAAT